MALWKIAEHRKPAIRTLFLLPPLSLYYSLSPFFSLGGTIQSARRFVTAAFLAASTQFLVREREDFLAPLARAKPPDATRCNRLVSPRLVPSSLASR